MNKEIKIGKYYRSRYDNIVVKATKCSVDGDFKGILIEDVDNKMPHGWLNNEYGGWVSEAFYQIEYGEAKQNDLFPMY